MNSRRFTYPRPGYFLELVVAHDWPPGYRAQAFKPQTEHQQTGAARSRATALARGHTGTIKGISTKAGAQIASPAMGMVKGVRG